MTAPYIGKHRRPVSDTRILIAAASTGITILSAPLLFAFAIVFGALHQAGAL